MATIAKGRFSIIAALIKLFPKLAKAFGGLLKAAKSLKVGTAAVSTVAYGLVFSWKFAVVIMAMLIVHEGGHVLEMKRQGMKVKGMYFIPFLGAVAVSDEAFPTRKAEAYTGIAGPLYGLLITAAAWGVYLLTGEPFFGAAAAWMAVVNLFNLLPIMPLDGGRILRSLSMSVNKTAGSVIMLLILAAAAYAAFVFGIGLFAIIIPLGAMELMSEFATARKYRKRREEIALFLEADERTRGDDAVVVEVGDETIVLDMQRVREEVAHGTFETVQQPSDVHLYGSSNQKAWNRYYKKSKFHIALKRRVDYMQRGMEYIRQGGRKDDPPFGLLRTRAELAQQIQQGLEEDVGDYLYPDEELAQLATRPGMNRRQMGVTILVTTVVVAALFWILSMGTAIPGGGNPIELLA